MRGIAYKVWASRLRQLFLILQFALPALVANRLFLPQIFAVAGLVLATLSPTFALVRPFVFGLSGVFDKRFCDGDGVGKCLSATSIKLSLGPIFEAVLEVEEGVLVEHVAYLEYEGSELVDVVADTTLLFKAT